LIVECLFKRNLETCEVSKDLTGFTKTEHSTFNIQHSPPEWRSRAGIFKSDRSVWIRPNPNLRIEHWLL